MRVYVQMQASDTHEYPSLIDTYWQTHTIDGVFPNDGDRRIYEEMKRLEATEFESGDASGSGGYGDDEESADDQEDDDSDVDGDGDGDGDGDS
ncbi:hypothetical protein Tco_0495689 [Tanacetum coccineum]